MLPAWIAARFGEAPRVLIDRCLPFPWSALATPPGPGTRSVRDILVHMVDSEALWIGHIARGQPYEELDPSRYADLEAIRRIWEPQRTATLAFTESLPMEEWSARRPLPADFGPGQTTTVEETIWHTVTHDFYHRGQIATRLALLRGS